MSKRSGRPRRPAAEEDDLGPALVARMEATGLEPLEAMVAAEERPQPRLATPSIAAVIQRTRSGRTITDTSCDAAIDAMRVAAEKRIATILHHSRRRHYLARAVTVDTRAAWRGPRSSGWHTPTGGLTPGRGPGRARSRRSRCVPPDCRTVPGSDPAPRLRRQRSWPPPGSGGGRPRRPGSYLVAVPSREPAQRREARFGREGRMHLGKVPGGPRQGLRIAGRGVGQHDRLVEQLRALRRREPLAFLARRVTHQVREDGRRRTTGVLPLDGAEPREIRARLIGRQTVTGVRLLAATLRQEDLLAQFVDVQVRRPGAAAALGAGDRLVGPSHRRHRPHRPLLVGPEGVGLNERHEFLVAAGREEGAQACRGAVEVAADVLVR